MKIDIASWIRTRRHVSPVGSGATTLVSHSSHSATSDACRVLSAGGGRVKTANCKLQLANEHSAVSTHGPRPSTRSSRTSPPNSNFILSYEAVRSTYSTYVNVVFLRAVPLARCRVPKMSRRVHSTRATVSARHWPSVAVVLSRDASRSRLRCAPPHRLRTESDSRHKFFRFSRLTRLPSDSSSILFKYLREKLAPPVDRFSCRVTSHRFCALRVTFVRRGAARRGAAHESTDSTDDTRHSYQPVGRYSCKSDATGNADCEKVRGRRPVGARVLPVGRSQGPCHRGRG